MKLRPIWLSLLRYAPRCACAIALLCVTSGSATAGWTTFTRGDSLTGAYDIHCDSSGTLWLAGIWAVHRFDGKNWGTLKPGGASNSGVLQDKHGALWFSTFGDGVIRLDDGIQTVFTTADGLAGNAVQVMETDSSGTMWFGTVSGLSRFDGRDWSTFDTGNGLLHNQVSTIKATSSGDLWIGMRQGIVSRFDGSAWAHFGLNPGVVVTSIEEDASGHLWFGDELGLWRYDGVRWTPYTTADGLVANEIRDITLHPSGALWIATDAGASRFDGKGWETFLPGERVRTVAVDQSGALWFSFSGGQRMKRFDQVSWETFLAGRRISSIEVDRGGDVWVATQSARFPQRFGIGAMRFDGTNWTTFDTSDGLADDSVIDVHVAPSGDVWLGTGNGVSRFDGANWTTFTEADGLASPDSVFAIHAEPSGAVWFGTHGGGVSRFDGTTWATHDTSDGLVHDNVWGLEIDHSGDLWVGAVTGLSRFDGASWHSYTAFPGPESDFMLEPYADPFGILWVATWGGGVKRLENGQWTTITKDDGLLTNNVVAIERDTQGDMWFSHDDGVSRLNNAEWSDFTTDDGLTGGLVLAIAEDSTGGLWFGTNDGLARHRPDRVPPQTIITFPPSSVSANRNPSVLLEIGFRETGDFEFSHSLDGDSWSPWSGNNSWTGELLVDGVHELAVRSRDRMGNVDPTPAAVSFEIDATPPDVLITSPGGAPVSGTVPIVGTSADARFKEARLETRPVGSASWTVLAESSSSVTNGVLGVWNTRDVADGKHQVRLSVSDTLGLVGTTNTTVEVDNEFPPAERTSPAIVSAASGGDVYTTHEELHLYFPPGAFDDDATVELAIADATSIPDVLPDGARRAMPGAAVSWGGTPLRKSAILNVSLEGLPPGIRHEGLSIYSLQDGATWTHVGGTVDRTANTISTDVSGAAHYAVFDAAAGVPALNAGVQLGLTPRVFSPNGGFASSSVAISFSLDRAAAATVKVYNRAGRMVREVTSGGMFQIGTNVVRWDGRDTRGDIAAEGVYVVTVEVLGETRTKTLAIVR